MKNKNTQIGLQSGQGVMPHEGHIRIFASGTKKSLYQMAFFLDQQEREEIENKKMNGKG